MLKDHLHRIETIDRLIRIKSTGNPKVLAQKVNVSERSLYGILAFMKERGAPIAYCRYRKSYYYEHRGHFSFEFVEDVS
jgi:hypothetical protein